MILLNSARRSNQKCSDHLSANGEFLGVVKKYLHI